MKQKNNEQLCPECQTGYDTYLLDDRNPFCPYIQCHNGTSCTMFKPLKKYRHFFNFRGKGIFVMAVFRIDKTAD